MNKYINQELLLKIIVLKSILAKKKFSMSLTYYKYNSIFDKIILLIK